MGRILVCCLGQRTESLSYHREREWWARANDVRALTRKGTKRQHAFQK
jgi:hypothetical protein